MKFADRQPWPDAVMNYRQAKSVTVLLTRAAIAHLSAAAFFLLAAFLRCFFLFCQEVHLPSVGVRPECTAQWLRASNYNGIPRRCCCASGPYFTRIIQKSWE